MRRDTIPETYLETDDDDPIENLLRQREAARAAENISNPTPKRDIVNIIREYANQPPLPRQTDIVLYWEGRKYSDPELYSLATTILAVPMTQVSVERTFSHLKFILNTLRSNLSPSLVNDILVVRCNRLFREKQL